jgi:tricorn protease
MRNAALSFLFLAALCGRAGASGDKPLLLRKPTLSKTQIAFSFAGDLWVVGRDGGEARRLTSGVGVETDPIFSPDGSQIAFTGDYDGNLDVYVIPTAGGAPRRLTYHPGADMALGWTPDGKNVLFTSGRTSHSQRYSKLFTVPVEGGGLPTELPLPMGIQGAYSPDGTHIAYVPFANRVLTGASSRFIAWKRYRGGLASPVWIADLSDSKIEKVPRVDSTDFCPMWLAGKLYFLSDRDGPVTLYCFDPETREVKQVLQNQGYELSSASAGPDAIVYEQFGSLYLFDPKTNASKLVDVRISADFPSARPHFVKVGKKIQAAAISPTGARAVFETRGEILTVPAEKGDIRNLTETSNAAERDPTWSPDGKTIAYFSDESGEYLLYLRDAKGARPPRHVELGGAPSFYYHASWSPDSKQIAYSDAHRNLWVLNVASGKSVKVDNHTYFEEVEAIFDTDWSPDSRWLAYTKLLDNKLRAAFFYDTQASKSHQITDGMSDVRYPAFDKGGKYLFFTASTDVGPTTNSIDMSAFNRPISRSVYVAVLDKETPSPLGPESDEEKAEESKKPDSDKAKDAKAEKKKGDDKKKGESKKKDDAKSADKVTKIDLEGIDQRVLALPLPARNYTALTAGKAGTIFLQEKSTLPILDSPAGPEAGPATVTKFDLSKRKSEKLLDDINAFDVSANGDKALYQQGEQWYIAGIADGPPKPEKPLRTEEMEIRVDPRAEWKQMYHEVWRLQRDFLYDAHAHGLDLAAAEKKYSVFLDGMAHRADLNYLFQEMLGNLVLGHTYISGGDTPEVPRVKGGLLGADWKIENGRYRIAHIYSGESWNPQLRAPLTQPGLNVKEGDYLLAVNGKELKGADNVYQPFVATAGKSVIIKIGPNPDGHGAREVTVVPAESEVGLRNLAWIEGNRRKVDKLSGGKLAYVYLPDTYVGGYKAFNRYFFAQLDKQGLVVDERFNGGGLGADYVIEYLRRPLLNYWTTRDGKISTSPGGAIFGPKAMIINEFAGSGGDLMPWYFRRMKVGPLVGKRTWGGLVGIDAYPTLLDGGQVTAPDFAFFTPEGTWDVENHGVAPDVEIDHDPYEVRKGHDPQLEKAVEIVLEELKKNPPKQPKQPEYPNYYKVTAGEGRGKASR